MVRGVGGCRHQVGVQSPQVDRRDGANPTKPGHRAGQATGRDAHAHPALDNRDQGLAFDGQWPKARGLSEFDQIVGELRRLGEIKRLAVQQFRCVHAFFL